LQGGKGEGKRKKGKRGCFPWSRLFRDTEGTKKGESKKGRRMELGLVHLAIFGPGERKAYERKRGKGKGGEQSVR